MSDVTLDADAVDEALTDLENGMKLAETTLSHDKVRPSTVGLAQDVKEAYRVLVDAHPDYELNEGGEDE